MNSLLNRSLETGEVLEMIYMSNKGQLSQRQIKVLEVSDDSIQKFCYLQTGSEYSNLQTSYRLEQSDQTIIKEHSQCITVN
jgi:Tfp pilus assembly protein PilE